MSGDVMATASVAITGSSRGIGAAVAKDRVNAGASVVINGRDAEAVERTRAEIADIADRAGGVVDAVVGAAHEPGVAEELCAKAGEGRRFTGLI